jgi:hypothetical protein
MLSCCNASIRYGVLPPVVVTCLRLCLLGMREAVPILLCSQVHARDHPAALPAARVNDDPDLAQGLAGRS